MEKIFVLSCFFTLAICGVPNINEKKGSQVTNTSTVQPQFIGFVDGKSFFYDHTVQRDWQAAKRYCESFDLQLASIENKGQFDVLNMAYSEVFLGHYWVSGRDSFEPTQFVWDTKRTEVPLDVPYYKNLYALTYQTCLRYASNPNMGSYLYPRPCGISVAGVICETP